jgi:hypothetical protein
MTDEIIISPQDPIELTLSLGSPIPQRVTAEEVIPLVSYTHNQSATADQWVITHNLGFKPSVTAFDSAGDIVEGHIIHNSVNQLTMQFSASLSGTAQLS